MSPASSSPALARFLSAVYRRAVLLRFVERTALGLLGGMLLASVTIGLLWAQGRPVAGVLPLTGCAGAAAGFVWAALRRPTRLEAALLADRQLDLEDLLGTAAALLERPVPGDEGGWSATILHLADARCRSLRPRDVVLHRLGARAWGGVGVAGLLAMTLSALAGTAGMSQASTPTNPTAAEARTAPPPLDRPLLVLGDATPRSSAPRRDPTEDDRNSDRPSTERPPPQVAGAAAMPPAAGTARSPGGSDAAGAGTGYGKSPLADPGPAKQGNAASPGSRGSPAAPTDGALAGGGSNSTTERTGPAAIGRTTDGSNGAAVAPWQSAGWADDVAAARRQLEGGTIPAAYRSLIRAYFDTK